ncbi:uncharacterized protein JCM6883_002290 [Sporobolomyces salmoneus]|uniref:uncharacterized protein n=1 Tax=Sporobolomyces salmoneus TaxID=183962 RepID=UPI0031736F87
MATTNLSDRRRQVSHDGSPPTYSSSGETQPLLGYSVGPHDEELSPKLRQDIENAFRVSIYLSLVVFVCLVFFGLRWIGSALSSSLSRHTVPSVLSPAPELTVYAARSTSTFSISYDNDDSPSFTLANYNSLVALQEKRLTKPSSTGELHVEIWSSENGAEIGMEVASPCEVRKVDLRVGPLCVSEDDCTTILAELDTLTDLTKCDVGNKRAKGIKNFFVGATRVGNRYGFEQKGFDSGTGLDLARDDGQGFDWSWKSD